MRKSILYIFILMVLETAGCSSDYSNYQCKNNDECLVGSKGQTSCSIETNKCEPVSPITMTDNGKWKPPKVGQTNFSVELVASGGIPPYSWDFAKINDNGKLDWLTYRVEESSNRVKLWLVNKVVDNVTQTPQNTIESGAGTRIKVTVRDNTKIGENMDRIDNKGAEWETTVTLEECTTEQCESDDGCCQIDNCTINSDNDCPPRCGDGIVTSPEICDTGISAGLGDACPTTDTCNDNNVCTVDTIENDDTCQAMCIHTAITECLSGDGCCLLQCNHNTDSDCPVNCGNGAIESGETCDPPASCPTNCDDGDACTTDNLTGYAANCTAACTHLTITQCNSGDGCCPYGCHHDHDTDCACNCGNGYVDASCNEICDGNCPTSCDDGNACTTDSMTGSASMCNSTCSHAVITTCALSVANVAFTLKYVPGGTFPIGEDDAGGNQTVSAFWLGETEVTYELWSVVYTWATSQGGYSFANPGRQGADANTGPVGTNQHPVTTITWRDAMVWCNAVSELAGLTPVYTTADHITPIRSVDNVHYSAVTAMEGNEDNPYVNNDANGFQLPGSMQWECAARYLNGTSWTPGNYASGATANYTNFNATSAVAWFGNSTVSGTGNTTTTKPVKGKTANALGIYDMSGNVEEWCFDHFEELWIDFHRVIRGGAWNSSINGLKLGLESACSPPCLSGSFGFRLIKTK